MCFRLVELALFDGPAQWYHRVCDRSEVRKRKSDAGGCGELAVAVTPELYPMCLMLLRSLEHRGLIEIWHRRGNRIFLRAERSVLLRGFSDPEICSRDKTVSVGEKHVYAALQSLHPVFDICKHDYQLQWLRKINQTDIEEITLDSGDESSDSGASDLSYLCSGSLVASERTTKRSKDGATEQLLDAQ